MDILSLYKKLIQLPDLSPSDKVNFLFGELVRKVILSQRKSSLGAARRLKLQQICSEAEYQLEKHWAMKIVSSENPESVLLNFPYFENYQKLTRLEFHSLAGCDCHLNHKNLFIGGGPLPLTAIILARDFSIKSVVIDSNKEAVSLSQKLIKLLGLDDKIKVFQSSAEDFEFYRKYDVIFVAALAGVTENSKKEILMKIRRSGPKDGHILLRSSWGNREMLYRPVKKSLLRGFMPLIEVNPLNDIVNSILIVKNDYQKIDS